MTTADRKYRPSYDEYVVCPTCKVSYQLLDWHCAVHRLRPCGNKPVPQADQKRIIANAAAHGIELYWR